MLTISTRLRALTIHTIQHAPHRRRTRLARHCHCELHLNEVSASCALLCGTRLRTVTGREALSTSIASSILCTCCSSGLPFRRRKQNTSRSKFARHWLRGTNPLLPLYAIVVFMIHETCLRTYARVQARNAKLIKVLWSAAAVVVCCWCGVRLIPYSLLLRWLLLLLFLLPKSTTFV